MLSLVSCKAEARDGLALEEREVTVKKGHFVGEGDVLVDLRRILDWWRAAVVVELVFRFTLFIRTTTCSVFMRMRCELSVLPGLQARRRPTLLPRALKWRAPPPPETWRASLGRTGWRTPKIRPRTTTAQKAPVRQHRECSVAAARGRHPANVPDSCRCDLEFKRCSLHTQDQKDQNYKPYLPSG